MEVKESEEGEESLQSATRVACKDRRFRYRDDSESCVGCATTDLRQDLRQVETEIERLRYDPIRGTDSLRRGATTSRGARLGHRPARLATKDLGVRGKVTLLR